MALLLDRAYGPCLEAAWTAHLPLSQLGGGKKQAGLARFKCVMPWVTDYLDNLTCAHLVTDRALPGIPHLICVGVY